MARQILPIVGAVIGGIYGGPMGAQAGAAIGSLIGNAVDPQIIKGPSLGDGQQTVSQEGTPRPIIYGTGCVGGNIIAKGELVKKKKRKRQGKGGPVQETEHFYMTYALRICEGPIKGVIRIWEDEKLVYDLRSGGLVSSDENNKYGKNFKIYLGDETQLPDPDLEVVFGVGDTPAFRGTAYIVFPNRELTERQGSVPNYRFEVTTSSEAEIDTKTSFVSYQNEFVIQNEKIVRKGLNEELGNPDFPTQYNFSKDALYVNYLDIVGMTARVYIFKYNPETERYDTEIPFEAGGVDIPGYGLINFGHSSVSRNPDFFNERIFFINVNGYIFVYEIVNDVAIFKSYFERITGSNGTSDIEKFFPYNNNKLIGVGGGAVYTFDFNTSTYTLSNPVLTTGISMVYAPYSVDFKDGKLVFRTSTLRIYNLKTDGTFELIATKTGLHPGFVSNSDFKVKFSKTWNNVFTIGRDEADNQKLIALSVIPAEISGYEIIEQNILEQPADGIATNTQVNFDFNGEYFVCPVKILGSTTSDFVKLALYKANSSGDDLDLIDTYAIQRNDPSFDEGTIQRSISMIDFVPQNNIDGGPWEVKDIILDISDRLKIDVNKIDVSDISDLSCDGLIVAQQYTGANVIRKLQEVFFFDPTEYDKKLNFLKRGKPAVKAITFEECVADSYEAERKSAIEYPRKIELMYQNARIGYVGAKAVAERISPDFAVSGTQTFESPIVLNEDKAAQAVDKMHKVSWADAEGNVKFSLPAEFQDLVVADCIAFYMRDTVQRLRIETIEAADGILSITARVDRQSAYTSAVTGLPLPDPTAPPGTITGVTIWAYLDIPALVDNNDALLYYYAGTGAAEAWHGYVMQRSDFEADFEDVGSSSNAEGVGYLTNAVSNASEHYVDNTNEIIVQMYNDVYDFESVTTEQLLNEKNAIAICRSDGSAEIIQYKDAEYLENNLWKLTHLIRGRLNSKTSAHAINAQVVILDTVNAEPVNSPLLNKILEHRAVSYDSSPEDAQIRSYEFKGRSQIEFPVDLLSVENDGTNINVSWSPRERFGTDINPVRSINWQNYEIEISDGVTTQNVYSLLPQAQFLTSDFSGAVTVNVWQINRFTGRGEVASAVINV